MVKKKDKYPHSFVANVLIYNDEMVNYRHCVPISIDAEPRCVICDNGYYQESKPIYNTITIQTSCYEELENITLDPTTMKRIAEFNKSQQCKRLDKEIKEKQEKVKELDDLLKDKEKRWNKVKDYIKNIYEIEIDDYEEDW